MKNYKRILLFVLLLVLKSNAYGAFSLFSTHPYAIQLSSTGGDTIEDLRLFNNKIYAGYGNYNNHTNPTRVCAFQPPSNQFVCETTIDSETVHHFRIIGNTMYVIGGDPRPSNFDFFAQSSGGNWFKQAAFTSNVAHVYDIESSGGTLWLTLTKFDDDTRLMKRLPNGSWVESLTVRPISGHTTSNYSVLFFVAEFQGKLYTQAMDTGIDGVQPFSRVSLDNGVTWNNDPSILLHRGLPNIMSRNDFKHYVFANHLVMQQGEHLVKFNGSVSETIQSDVRDYTIQNGVVYILKNGGEILQSTNLNS